jgi:hypothetical protein
MTVGALTLSVLHIQLKLLLPGYTPGWFEDRVVQALVGKLGCARTGAETGGRKDWASGRKRWAAGWAHWTAGRKHWAGALGRRNRWVPVYEDWVSVYEDWAAVYEDVVGGVGGCQCMRTVRQCMKAGWEE